MTDQSDTPIIETIALTKQFDDLTAVDHIDLSVNHGEIFGLLGPNGAGKTTTIGMLTTRVVPTSGSATIGGYNIVKDPVAAKQIVGVVSQQNTLDRSLNVFENLYFHGKYFGMNSRIAKSETEGLLDQFRLSDRANSPVEALSGGMAQRLMVARAIMHKPHILFLDEPTAGLDPQSRIALWEILQELHKIGQTIVLTTHYMEEADQLSDRVAIMDHGKLLAVDTPQKLKDSVSIDTTILLTPMPGQLEALEKSLKTFDGLSNVHTTDNACRVELSGSTGKILPRIFAHLESAGVTVTDVSISEPTLETVFIDLTGKDLRE
jgi:ABC-2 type transport system ATP-binding protein